VAGGEAALASYAEQERVMEAAVRAALMVWADLDPSRFTASWVQQQIGERLFLTTSRAQELAAMAAEQATALILLEQLGSADDVPEAEGRVNTIGLAGIASDGRPLESLLLQPLIQTNVALASGMTALEALAAGASVLTRIVGTQVQDAGRASTGLSIAARPRTGWIRLVEPKACSRCVVLAGRFYRWSAGFDRHPLCKCRNIPASEDTEDLTPASDPMANFRSLSEADQNRQFTKAGAQAIRDGADISRVVNARRSALGLSQPGRLTAAEQRMLRGGRDIGHLDRVDVYGRKVYVTREATTVRSSWGKAEIERFGNDKAGRYRVAKSPRLMPESVYEIATDRADAVRLLKRFGYIL
jgi:hypothetical protein